MGVATLRIAYLLRIPSSNFFFHSKMLVHSTNSCAMTADALLMIDTGFSRPINVWSNPLSKTCVVHLGCVCMGSAKYSFGFVHPLFRILSISREWPWYVISILLQEIKPQVVPVIWRYRSRCIDICSERCDFLKSLSTSMSDGCCVYPSIIVQSVLMIKMWLISIMK